MHPEDPPQNLHKINAFCTGSPISVLDPPRIPSGSPADPPIRIPMCSPPPPLSFPLKLASWDHLPPVLPNPSISLLNIITRCIAPRGSYIKNGCFLCWITRFSTIDPDSAPSKDRCPVKLQNILASLSCRKLRSSKIHSIVLRARGHEAVAAERCNKVLLATHTILREKTGARVIRDVIRACCN